MSRNIKDCGNAMLKKKIYIILITIIFALTGMAYTLANVEYVSVEKILLGSSENEKNLITTYKELIKSSSLLEKVSKNIDGDISIAELSNWIEVSNIENTNMLEIKVYGENPEYIQKVSDEISNQFIETVEEIYQNKDLYVVDSAVKQCNSQNAIFVTIICALIGFLLSNAFFLICFLLDIKIKSCKDIEELTGLKSLISIPQIKVIAKKKLNIKNIRAHKSEVFKTLMTNIQFVNSNNLKSKSIVITSAMPFEGKTYVANNLAIEFAKAGKKVIIIDGDMRRGRIAKIYNLPNDLGFSNYLSNIDSNGNIINDRITRFINDTEVKNLNVITSGNIPPNPTELLRVEKLEELIKDLKVFYDIIIFDTVPVLEAPESTILSKTCDLTLILSAYGTTKKEELIRAYNEINRTDGSVIGMGLNKIPDKKIRKKMIATKGILKKNLQNNLKKLVKISKVFIKIENVLKLGLGVVGNWIYHFVAICKDGISKIMDKSENVKENVREYIKKYRNKREKIKLIEAGSVTPEEANDSNLINENKNNIIRDVFETEMAKLENDDEIEYQKKLNALKSNISEKKIEEDKPSVNNKIIRPSNPEMKSKFDLIREQQENGKVKQASIKQEEKVKQTPIKQGEKVKKIPIKQEEKVQMEISDLIDNKAPVEVVSAETEKEALIRKQKMEREKKELEKKKRQELIENYEEIDFSSQEIITEEMVRQQVEMDEMIRLSAMEEEEERLKQERMKLEMKAQRKHDRKEKREKFKEETYGQIINAFNAIKQAKADYVKKSNQKHEILEEERIRRNEAKMAERIKREAEKIENKARIAKVKEEKRVYKEMEKQRQREEERIREELLEDNLYPKPRM